MTSRESQLGPYQLGERIGSGGMGEVFRAFDERLERGVAVKVIRAESAADEGRRERFRREARAAARLSHPSIVQIYDVVSTAESDAIVMELVEGTTLAELIRGGPIDVETTLRWAEDVAEGLADAHGHGLVHRDRKTENVMVTQAGRAKILDFGLAKRLQEGGAAPDQSLTAEGMIVGTYRAMSPEQARGLPLDHRSDLFSFGTLLYETLAGTSPFPGVSLADTVMNLCAVAHVPLMERNSSVPPALSALVDRLLEKDPARRPQRTEEVVDALRAIHAQFAHRVTGDSPEATGSLTVPTGALAAAPSDTQTLGKDSPRGLPTVAEPRAFSPAKRSRLVVGAAALAVAVGGGLYTLLGGFRKEPLYVAVPMPNVVRPATGPPLAIARATAAAEVLTTSLDCGETVCRAVPSRISGRDGSLLFTRDFEIPRTEPVPAVGEVEALTQGAYRERRVKKGFAAVSSRSGTTGLRKPFANSNG